MDEKNVRGVRGTRNREGRLLEEKAGTWVRVSPIRMAEITQASGAGTEDPDRDELKRSDQTEKVNQS